MMTSTTNTPLSQRCPNVSQLAVPYVYRRGSGRYYLRVRLKGTHSSHTVSLKTSTRATAMSNTKRLLSTLKAFHLDRPDATWEELRARLRDIAEEALGNPQGDLYGLVLSDIAEDLAGIAEIMPMGLDQAKALMMAQRVVRASQGRHSGDLRGIVELLEGDLKPSIGQSYQVEHPDSLSFPEPICMSQGVPKESLQKAQAMTFMDLHDAYMAERGEGMAPATIKNMTSTAKTVAGILGDLDMRSHTRANMVALKAALMETRKASTVNKLLTNVGALTAWGVATGLMTHDYARKLTITKGANSERQAFASGQIMELTKVATTGYLKGDWKGHALALGLSTGARIGEIHQVHGCDFIKDEDGQWFLSINDDNGKTLKNSHSRRVVPLVGIPEEIIKTLAAAPGRVFKQSMSGFAAQLNAAIRDTLGIAAGEGLSFHSLRHSLASDLKTQGVAVGVVQAILGHSSGSLAFDLYGSNAAASKRLMVDALRLIR